MFWYLHLCAYVSYRDQEGLGLLGTILSCFPLPRHLCLRSVLKRGHLCCRIRNKGKVWAVPPLHIERGPHYGVLTLWWRIEQPELDGT